MVGDGCASGLQALCWRGGAGRRAVVCSGRLERTGRRVWRGGSGGAEMGSRSEVVDDVVVCLRRQLGIFELGPLFGRQHGKVFERASTMYCAWGTDISVPGLQGPLRQRDLGTGYLTVVDIVHTCIKKLDL